MSRGLIALLALVVFAAGPLPAFACADGCDAPGGLAAESSCAPETSSDCRDCDCLHHGTPTPQPAPRGTVVAAPAVASAAPAPAAPAFADAPDVPPAPSLATGLESTVLRL